MYLPERLLSTYFRLSKCIFRLKQFVNRRIVVYRRKCITGVLGLFS